jgi:hypothetical protein
MKTGQEVMEEIEALIRERMTTEDKSKQWPAPIVVQQALVNIVVMFTRTKPERRSPEEEFKELDNLIENAYTITDKDLIPDLKVV